MKRSQANTMLRKQIYKELPNRRLRLFLIVKFLTTESINNSLSSDVWDLIRQC